MAFSNIVDSLDKVSDFVYITNSPLEALQIEESYYAREGN